MKREAEPSHEQPGPLFARMDRTVGRFWDACKAAGATLPYQPHSGPSRQAARAGEPRAPSQRHRVLVYLRSRGSDGATDEEGCVALDMNPSTYRPRRIELVRLGSVADSGATRASTQGRAMSVWVVT